MNMHLIIQMMMNDLRIFDGHGSRPHDKKLS